MLLNCGVGEDSWESLGLQGDPTSPFWRRSALGFLWKDWCWSWNSSTLATSCEELTHWRRLWCWEGLGAGGEGDDRGWDGWMASLTRWTWVWVNSGSWWWTGRPGVLWFMGSRRVGHDWVTELNWLNFVKDCNWSWQKVMLLAKQGLIAMWDSCIATRPRHCRCQLYRLGNKRLCPRVWYKRCKFLVIQENVWNHVQNDHSAPFGSLEPVTSFCFF